MRNLLQNTVNIFEEIFEQLVGALEPIWHAFVGNMPVMVVVRQALARVFKLLWGFDRMRVVVSQHSFAVRLVERQGITNAVRDVTIGFDTPSFNFDPVAVALIEPFRSSSVSRPRSSRMRYCIIR